MSNKQVRDPTQAELCHALRYDPDTGLFSWLNPISMKYKRGSQAGYWELDGYVSIGLLKLGRFEAHRLAWLYIYGEMPLGIIDHINGRRDDNRIANLRVVTPSENQQNRRGPQRNSATGLLGVCRAGKRWKAQLAVGGRNKHLGHFDTPEEAHEAYIQAKRQYHPACTF